MIQQVEAAFQQAQSHVSNLHPDVLTVPGMSGRNYRRFVNNLVSSLPDPRYLEVGCWTGSTLCSALNGNTAPATVIDNWSQYSGPREVFLFNVKQFVEPAERVELIDSDFREVDFSQLGKFNVYMYDGPHRAEDQYDGIAKALPALADTFVLIIDDWNWDEVRLGTEAVLSDTNLKVLYSREVRTTTDGSHPEVGGADSDWHNGYFIAVLQKF